MWVSGELNAVAVLPQERKPCPLDRKLGAVSVSNDTVVCLSDHVMFGCSHTCTFYIFCFVITKSCHFHGKFLIQLTVTDEVIWS
jgi:predicted metal-binding transcription factor (methanogenesis marker protein 9)